MEKFVEQALLYDFYGELLTERQQQVYEAVVFNDFSYSEIAREQGISRQSVHELIHRCDTILMDYEEKLHLVEHFLNLKHKVEIIKQLTAQYRSSKEEALLEQIEEVSQSVIDEV
ncbi:MAG: YlxM family DNA-binding protein [Lachnospiraceae bacterium]